MAATARLRKGSVLFICGYRRHGKDEFFKWMKQESNHEYRFYVRKDFKSRSLFANLPPTAILQSMSFALSLKEKTAEKLGITPEELELKKDNVLENTKPYEFKIIKPSDISTATHRDVLIDIAAVKRNKRPTYFSEKTSLLQYCSNKVGIITDFRYPDEYQHFAEFLPPNMLFTLRVHRSEVAVPDADIISEHALDSFKTDFVVTSKTSTNVAFVENDYDLLE